MWMQQALCAAQRALRLKLGAAATLRRTECLNPCFEWHKTIKQSAQSAGSLSSRGVRGFFEAATCAGRKSCDMPVTFRIHKRKYGTQNAVLPALCNLRASIFGLALAEFVLRLFPLTDSIRIGAIESAPKYIDPLRGQYQTQAKRCLFNSNASKRSWLFSLGLSHYHLRSSSCLGFKNRVRCSGFNPQPR